MITVNPEDITAIILAQRAWLEKLQEADPTHPIKIKIIEGAKPDGGDYDLYAWKHFRDVWHKVTSPIYTRSILFNEILIDPDSESWQDVSEGIGKLHSFCNENDIPYTMGFSGGKGIHFSIIFGTIRAGDPESTKSLFEEVEKYNVDSFKIVRRALLFEIASRAGVDLEKIGMDKKKINFRVTRMGSQVREFGTIRAPGKYKTLIMEIPEEKPEPNELNLVFPDEVEIWNIRDTEYNEIAIDAIRNEIEKAKNADEYTPISNENFKDIPITKFPCIDKLFKVGIRNGRYYAGVAVVLMCQKCGISKEETAKHLQTLFKTFPGISKADTEIRVRNALEMYGKEYHFSCTEIKDTFSEHDLCNFSQCPVKEKIEEVKQNEENEHITNLLRGMIPSPDENIRIEQVKNVVVEHLMGIREDKAEEIIIRLCKIFGITGDLKTNVKKFYRMLKTVESTKSYLTFGKTEDSAAHAVAVLAGEFSLKYKPVFCLGGDLYAYENGIYQAGETVYSDAKRFIYDLAVERGLNISPNSVNKVIKRICDINTVSANDLNVCPERIVVDNGILDTKNRIQYDHNPDEKHINKIPIFYNPEAKITPEFEDFLKTIFVGVEWQIPIVQEMFGFCLYKEYLLEKFFFLVGDGGNGRSILLNVLTDFLGLNNISGLTLHEVCKPPDKHILISLHGKFANVCGETGNEDIKDIGTAKRATGGDLIETRDLYKSWIKFYNYAKFFFSMNEPPVIHDNTRGRKRRMVILDFPVKFVAGKNAKDKEVLKTELTKPESLSGMLNWALEGLDRLLKNRVFSDERSEAVMALNYEKKSNPMKYFVHEHIDSIFEGLDDTTDKAAFAASRVTEAKILEAYILYAKKHTLPSINKTKIIASVKYECERVGIFVNQCRDRYTVDNEGNPKYRENYLKGIKICGLEHLKPQIEPEKGDIVSPLKESESENSISIYKYEESETASPL
jgi:P4 family phage/plasmid primase-like protien